MPVIITLVTMPRHGGKYRISSLVPAEEPPECPENILRHVTDAIFRCLRLGGNTLGNRQGRGGIPLAGGGVYRVHPDRQRERAPVAVGHDGFRLVKADPDAAGERLSVADEPGVLVIVGGAC